MAESNKNIWQTKKRPLSQTLFFVFQEDLLTQTESLNYGTIALDILTLEVAEQTTTLTYELHERAVGNVVLVVCLYMLCKVLDAISEESNLALARTCVGWSLSILTENLLFLFRI